MSSVAILHSQSLEIIPDNYFCKTESLLGFFNATESKLERVESVLVIMVLNK